MFLTSLIHKRRSNRRSSKPNILLDALLSNAIINIKNDKVSSKLSITCSKKKNRKGRSVVCSSNLCERERKQRSDAHLGKRVERNQDNLESESYINSFRDLDNFFVDLRNQVKPLSTGLHLSQLDGARRNSSVTSGLCRNEHQSLAAYSSSSSSTQDLVDHFIETGMNGL